MKEVYEAMLYRLVLISVLTGPTSGYQAALGCVVVDV